MCRLDGDKTLGSPHQMVYFCAGICMLRGHSLDNDVPIQNVVALLETIIEERQTVLDV